MQLRKPKTGEQCPGEENCSPFKKTKGTHSEREKNACGNCPMFPTKIRAFESNQEIENIERFIKEKRAGFTPDEALLTIVEYEGVIYWTDIEHRYDLFYQNVMLQSLGAISGLFGKK